MNFNIYNQLEERVALLSLDSVGGQTNVIEPYIEEKLSSYEMLYFSVLANSQEAKYLVEGNTILFKDIKGWREYSITEIVDSDGEELKKDITAELSSNELADEPFEKELKAFSNNPETILSALLEETRWEVGYVDEGLYNKNFNGSTLNKNVLECISEVASEYSAEVQYSYEVSGNKIVSRKVNLYKKFGRDEGKRFEIGKDITEITRTVDATGIKTAIIPTTPERDIEGSEEKEIIDITNIEWSKEKGDPADKPKGQNWLGSPEALENFGRIGPDGQLRNRFLFMEIDTENANSLISLSWVQLNRYTTPKVTYEVKAVDLYKITKDENLKHEQIFLGDTVRVIDKKFSVPIVVETRVVEVKRNLLDGTENEYVFGNSKSMFVNSYSDRIDEINDKLGQIVVDLGSVQENADGYTTTYRGSQEPEAPKEGDVWFRPHPTKPGENQMLIYSGSVWELAADTSVEEILSDEISGAKNEAADALKRAKEAADKADLVEGALSLKVGTDELNSAISVIENNINLKVSKDDVINQINISDEEVLIAGNKIIISGDTTVDGSFKVTNQMIAAGITADKITSGTINGQKINVINLNADNITGGNLNVQNVKIKNGDTTILSVNQAGEVEMQVAKLKIGSSEAATKEDVQTAIQKAVKATDTEYYLSTSKTELLGGSWSSFAPEWTDGKFMWSRNVTYYYDNSISYAPSEKGTCIAGATGEDGKGIESTVVDYQVSKSGTVAPTGTWASKPPETPENEYLWTRTTINYTDGAKTVAYSIAKAGGPGPQGEPGVPGIQGPQGNQGIQGPKGHDGKSSYTHIAYANSEDGSIDFSTSDSDRTYIGMYVDNTAADSSDPTKYGWSKIVGPQGEKGETGATGTPGKAGANGKTPYFHTAYANSADGKTDFSVSDSANKLYLGTYTDYTAADSTDPTKYSWSKIKGDTGDTGATGDKGQSVYSISEEYYLSTSKTGQIGGSWSGTAPKWLPNRWLWTRNKIVYKDPAKTEYTAPYLDSSWEAMEDIGANVKTWAESAINLTNDKIDLSVKKVTEVENKVDNIEVGGRNYFSVIAWKNRPSFQVSSIDAIKIKLEPLHEYTLSTNIPTWPPDSPTCDLFLLDSNPNSVPNSGYNGVAINKPRTIKTLEDGIIIVAMRRKEFVSGNWWAMLSKGNKALDWSPAPEDVQGNIDSLGNYTAYANDLNGKDFTTKANNENLISGQGVGFVAEKTTYTASQAKSAGIFNLDIERLNKERALTVSAFISVKNSQRIAPTGAFRIGYEGTITLSDGKTGWIGVWHNGVIGETFSGRVKAVYELPAGVTASSLTSNGNFYHQMNGEHLEVKDLKIEYGKNPSSKPIYTPSPIDDPVKAHMQYIGYSIKDSNDYKDYTWQINPEVPLKKAWKTGENGEGFTTVYPGENLVSKKLSSEGYVNSVDGTVIGAGAPKERITDYIPIEPNTVMFMQQKVTIKAPGGEGYGWWGVGYYDTNKEFLSRPSAVSQTVADGTEVYFEYKWTAHKDAHFMRISWRDYEGSKIKVELGDKPTIYTPSPQDDPVNCYPKYLGTSPNGGEKWTDYTWALNPEYVAVVADNHISNVKEILESQIDVTAESILNTVSSAYQTTEGAKMTEEQLRSLITQTSSSWGVSLEQIQKDLKTVNGDLGAEVKKRSDYMTFYPGTNTPILEIGTKSTSGSSAIKLIITNESIGFVSGVVDLDNPMKNALAYFEADKFKINKGIIVESLRVGNHEMQKMDNGHTIFTFVG